MLTLVRRARRRLFHNELLFQGANAGSAALLAFILLMLLGTQILRWEVALLIPLAAAGAGLYVARQRVPGVRHEFGDVSKWCRRTPRCH